MSWLQTKSPDLDELRDRMVATQIAARGIENARVLAAMRRVPRHLFVEPQLAEFAYDDAPLPIGEGQTISQPFMVALMVEAAEIEPGMRVLDVGTGSGYAAAVAAELGAEVYSVERQPTLARAAARRLEELGYQGVRVRDGDGTLGWPEAAPFDAILVAAGSPDIPDPLKRQLKIGGRLIVPVGADADRQLLLRVRRTGEHSFDEEDLGDAVFVPLIGAAGWGDDRSRLRRRETKPSQPVEHIRDAAERLPSDDGEFGRLFDRFAGAKIVLIGEASHGTSEFYSTRARITQHLIARHGFTIVAVEADWPDAFKVNDYVRHRPLDGSAEPPFTRFPTWMWRNREVSDFVDWLRKHNERIADEDRQAGFYGLDLYSLSSSIESVLNYLDKTDPEAARVARQRYGCRTPWEKDPAIYGRVALTRGFEQCEAAVLKQLRELLEKRTEYLSRDRVRYFEAAQNARLIANAERYYRVMYHGSRESWNLRDTHMFETLEALFAARGPDSKAVVWAHNSHIGNAAATEMGMRGEINIGHLCRERFGGDAVLIGFGTDHGTVAAASDWDGPLEIKTVRPAHPDSYERLCHESGLPPFLLDLRAERNSELRAALGRSRLERAIGVIYRPETERLSHYFDAVLPEQFDAYIWFDETKAVTPLTADAGHGMPETYPFGL